MYIYILPLSCVVRAAVFRSSCHLFKWRSIRVMFLSSVHHLLVLHAHGVGHVYITSTFFKAQLRPSASWTQSQIIAAGAATLLAQFGFNTLPCFELYWQLQQHRQLGGA